MEEAPISKNKLKASTAQIDEWKQTDMSQNMLSKRAVSSNKVN